MNVDGTVTVTCLIPAYMVDEIVTNHAGTHPHMKRGDHLLSFRITCDTRTLTTRTITYYFFYDVIPDNSLMIHIDDHTKLPVDVTRLINEYSYKIHVTHAIRRAVDINRGLVCVYRTDGWFSSFLVPPEENLDVILSRPMDRCRTVADCSAHFLSILDIQKYQNVVFHTGSITEFQFITKQILIVQFITKPMPIVYPSNALDYVQDNALHYLYSKHGIILSLLLERKLEHSVWNYNDLCLRLSLYVPNEKEYESFKHYAINIWAIVLFCHYFYPQYDPKSKYKKQLAQLKEAISSGIRHHWTENKTERDSLSCALKLSSVWFIIDEAIVALVKRLPEGYEPRLSLVPNTFTTLIK